MRSIDHATRNRARGARRALLVCVASALHLACSDGPAPAPTPAPVPAPTPAPVPVPAPVPEVQHTVQKGETLWDIARAYGVHTAQILADNKLTPRDVRRLREGATLRIVGASAVIDVSATRPREVPLDELPALTDGAYHRLDDGESLWTVARQYDVPVEALLERNEMDDADVALLRVGQILIVPGITQEQVAKKAREQPGPEKPAKRVGISHELARGETIWDVAHAFQVGVSELMAANSLSADQVKLLRDGTRLFVPGVHQDKGGRIRRPTSAREARAAVVAKKLGLGTVTAAGALLHGRIDPRWIRAAGGADRLEGNLRWPLANGWFVRGFGSGEGGYHLAMDIAGEIGWNVRAAARGVVAYSGDQVKGFGNLVLVVHPGGWVTLYAHNSVNFVSAGETVERGAILAEVGSTGISRGPHVHFELIHKGQNCDPAPLFKPGVRHRSGKLADVTQVSWRAPNDRPSQVHCAKRRRHPRSRSVLDEDPTPEPAPE